MPILQLRRIWATDGKLSSHALVSIVRLTVETNLVTSKNLSFWCHNVPSSSHARSATVSIVALLMVVLYPVSGSVHDLQSRLTCRTQDEDWYVCPYVSRFISWIRYLMI